MTTDLFGLQGLKLDSFCQLGLNLSLKDPHGLNTAFSISPRFKPICCQSLDKFVQSGLKLDFFGPHGLNRAFVRLLVLEQLVRSGPASLRPDFSSPKCLNPDFVGSHDLNSDFFHTV